MPTRTPYDDLHRDDQFQIDRMSYLIRQEGKRQMRGRRVPCMFDGCGRRVVAFHTVVEWTEAGGELQMYVDDGLCQFHGKMVGTAVAEGAVVINELGWDDAAADQR